jgi:hypothetical protein
MAASHWYVSIDDAYHITRTNISDCRCECGKRLERGMDLRIDKPRPDQLCEKCVASFNPAPMGGPMSLPHYLEEQNHRLRAALNAINEHAKVSSGHEAVQALLLSGALKAEDIA